MSNEDWKTIEKELERLSPAPLPAEFEKRLYAARPVMADPQLHRSLQPSSSVWRILRLRWIAPAFATAVAIIWFCLPRQSTVSNSPAISEARFTRLTVDRVEIDRQLIDAFEGLAQMPDGQPLRFRCYDWVEHVRLCDSIQNVVFERNEPHREIIPVRYDHD